MTRIHCLILSTLCLGVLAACGGNGNSNPSPAPFDANPNYAAVSVTAGPLVSLTSANYKDALFASYLAASSASMISEGVDFMSGDFDNPSNKAGSSQLSGMLRGLPRFGQLPEVLDGVSESYSVPCDSSGSIQITDHDGGQPDVLDENDSRTVRFENCVSNKFTWSGETRVTVLSAPTSSMDDGPFPFNGDFNVGLKELKITVNRSGHTVELNGLGHILRNKKGANLTSDSLDGTNLTLKVTKAGSTEDLTVSKLSAKFSKTSTQTTTTELNTQVSSSRLGGSSVLVYLLKEYPLVELEAADDPQSGFIVAAGSSGVGLLGAGPSSARLALDANDDGVADLPYADVSWSDIL